MYVKDILSRVIYTNKIWKQCPPQQESGLNYGIATEWNDIKTLIF